MAVARPTHDLDQADRDLRKFGYCIVADVLTPAEVAALRARLVEQAAAERRDAIAYEFGEVAKVSGTENFTVRADEGTT